jgi:DNA primase
MAERISKQTIEELRARNDIEEVVGSYLELKRVGSSLKALCPFHKEKTPSFHVNTQRQIFHCFGCGVGGDVFRFVMMYEGVDFPTALRLLAERCGMRLAFEESPSPAGPRKDVLYQVLDQAATLYQRTLREHRSASAARAYLAERAIDDDAIDAFRIGYAPNIAGALERWSRKAGIPPELLEAVGLLARSDRDGSSYERFRDRVMFPIADEMGRTIGFSGRALDATAPAKYLNSPETTVFHKNRVLFALDKARQEMVARRVGILCEGQIDAIRCHRAGIANVVASQGTAITESHAQLLRRYVDDVVLVLDADRAGQDAAIRSAEVILSTGLSVRIATLPQGEDPDSLVRKQGADSLRALVEAASPLVDFQVRILASREDITTDAGRQRAVQAVLSSIARVPGAVQQDAMLRQLAHRVFVAEHILREDLRRLRRGRPAASAEAPAPVRTDIPTVEAELLALMAADPEVLDLARRYLPAHCYTHDDCRRLADHLYRDGNRPDWSLTAAVAEASEDCQRLAARIQMGPRRLVGEDATTGRVGRDLILCLRRRHLEQRRHDLRQRAMEAAGPEQERLTTAFQQLSMDIHQLRQGWDESLPLLELDDLADTHTEKKPDAGT